MSYKGRINCAKHGRAERLGLEDIIQRGTHREEKQPESRQTIHTERRAVPPHSEGNPILVLMENTKTHPIMNQRLPGVLQFFN